MAQLRAQAPFPRDLGLTPSTHTAVIPIPEDLTPSSASVDTRHTCNAQTYMQAN